jgi:cytidylate kinase
VKIYLDASATERARRRVNDPAHTGGREGSFSRVASDLEARDTSDRTRAASPLTIAPDAQIIDTTMLTIDQVIEEVMKIVAYRLSFPRSG